MDKLIIDKEYTESTLNWILDKNNRDNYLNPVVCGKYHNFSKQEENFINELGLDYTSIEIVGQIILSHYGLDLETPTNPYFNYRISWYSTGSEEKPNRSDNTKGKIALRFNIMLQKPKVGGLPTNSIEGITPGVDEVWLEIRGVKKCGFTKVTGDKDMVLLSIEYHVDEKIAKLRGWMNSSCKPIESSPVWNKANKYNEDKYYPYIGDKPKIDTTTLATELDEVKQQSICDLQEELYSDDLDLVRENYIRKKLGYDPLTEEDVPSLGLIEDKIEEKGREDI